MKIIRKLKYPITIILIIVLISVFIMTKKKLNDHEYEVSV